MSTDNVCAICLSGLSGSMPIGTTVPCGHCFHGECFRQLPSSAPCPMCNQATTSFCRVYLDLSGTPQGGTPPSNRGRRAITPEADRTARRNNSVIAGFSYSALDHPFAEGSFRLVSKGTYTDGERAGQPVVCKWFKSGHVMESVFFDLDIKAMMMAVDLVKLWNLEGFISHNIRVNVPEVWTFLPGCRREGAKALIEPFIENYQKFNSNTGWADTSTPWPLVMQAISHYSYHASGGEFLLCDLQGGVYSNSVVLTDPVILSRNQSFGVTDLGPKGISSFFSQHRCNKYCHANWRKPRDRTQYYVARRGSSMMTGIAESMPAPPRVLR